MNHFRRFSHKLQSPDDVYLVNQTGRGLGRNAYPKSAMYRVRGGSTGVSAPSKVEVVSPVAQSVNQAKALISSEKSRKKGTTKSKRVKKGAISKAGGRRGKTSGNRKHKKKKRTTTKKKKKRTKKASKKRSKK
jgi:hypothetical protein